MFFIFVFGPCNRNMFLNQTLNEVIVVDDEEYPN